MELERGEKKEREGEKHKKPTGRGRIQQTERPYHPVPGHVQYSEITGGTPQFGVQGDHTVSNFQGHPPLFIYVVFLYRGEPHSS